ncbi:MAG: HDOD domain-containing protein [Woeseia sp.]
MTAPNRQRIGRYEVVAPVGRGSQGSVVKAVDPVLDRFVAIKILSDANAELNTLADDGTPLEARIASQLKHPNVVPIYDAGEIDGAPYLVFEYVEGTTLAARLKKSGAMTIRDAVPVIDSVLKGLCDAHSRQILHLDLNPRNILFDGDGLPRIMDFGLAQYVTSIVTDDETVSGTLSYMSPEHMLGKPVGPWTDVFALGCTFYEVVSGDRVFKGSTQEEIQLQIVSAAIDYSALKALEFGPEFTRFLQGALERDASGRYADAAVMSEAFALFLSETGLGSELAGTDTNHSTIEFLMRRMARKADFPTVSQTLADINRMTGDESNASADKLSNVILRDFALTSKLLRLVNSAFYGTRASEITSVSQAVVFLGLEQVRMTANSLMFFGHLKGDSRALKDSLIRSFISGLIARHLARKIYLPQPEEAFISALCQNLGENLAIYYFPDEFADIEELRAEQQLGKCAASRGVLGVSYAELGAAVARTWNLPESIVAAIRGLPAGPLQQPENMDEALRDTAIFANELSDLFQSRTRDEMKSEIHWLLKKFERSIEVDHEYCVSLIAAGYEKLKEYAPLFELSVQSSDYCKAVRAWLDVQADHAPETADAAVGAQEFSKAAAKAEAVVRGH